MSETKRARENNGRETFVIATAAEILVSAYRHTWGCTSIGTIWTYRYFATQQPQTKRDLIGIWCKRPIQSGTQSWSGITFIHDFKVSLKYPASKSQYCVVHTSIKGCTSTSFAPLETQNFAHSSLQNSSNTVRLDGEHLWTVFRSFQRFCCRAPDFDIPILTSRYSMF